MYYDTYRGKKHRGRRRRRGCLGWLLGKLLGLMALALTLAVLAACLLYIAPVSFLNVEDADTELSLTDGLPSSHVNILLLGLDFLDEGQQRSDAIMIASIGKGGMKLTSVMRDTMVDIPGYGRHKLNSAYSYGGAELVMRVINETFHLNITNYAAVDLRTLVDVVDAVGGVTVSVEENELPNVNKFAWNTYKKISLQDGEKYRHYASSQPLTQTGPQKLNGLFATSYSRIRSIDSDYMRTARQREVIGALIDQIKENCLDVRMYLNLLDVARNSIHTNLNLAEMISLGEKVLLNGSIETHRVPENAHVLDNGSYIEIIAPEENIRALHEFIYS